MSNRLSNYLSSDPELRRYVATSRQIGQLERAYRAIAPAALTRSSRVLGYDGKRLVLAADNGAVASKLRQLAPQMISSFRTKGCEVTGIQIQVQVRTGPLPRHVQPRTLGPQGRRALGELAADLPEGDLKAAVQRLVARQR